MSIAAARSQAKKSVRTPFRWLAGFILAATLLGAAGLASVAFKRGTSAVPLTLIVALPGYLWLMRLAWYAAARGSAPQNDAWPFASRQILGAYCLIAALVAFGN